MSFWSEPSIWRKASGSPFASWRSISPNWTGAARAYSEIFRRFSNTAFIVFACRKTPPIDGFEQPARSRNFLRFSTCCVTADSRWRLFRSCIRTSVMLMRPFSSRVASAYGNGKSKLCSPAAKRNPRSATSFAFAVRSRLNRRRASKRRSPNSSSPRKRPTASRPPSIRTKSLRRRRKRTRPSNRRGPLPPRRRSAPYVCRSRSTRISTRSCSGPAPSSAANTRTVVSKEC